MVVANKSDLPVHADFHYDSLEARVIFDWENGYVESSAKEKLNINKIFKELLNQSKPRYGVSIPASNGNGSSVHQHRLQRLLSLQQKAAKKTRQIESPSNNLKRRQSLPITPQKMNSCANVPNVIEEEECASAVKLAANLQNSEKPKSEKRRSSFPAALRRNSCKVS